ncbi:iron-containing alcohol dehydrogenase [Clostridium minihomine]|uniref:iron-containing alcohol dehydrogenase n=1 Tax=Clostridium minihomine TaxID=2045012 RepID=UPI000C7903BD|nr:iron-containing alcohol dehydrogenase [Clostridium minihomine]
MSWRQGINVNNVSTIICGSHVFLGVGAIQKMEFIAEQLKSRGIDSVIVMTGKGAYAKTGAWDYVTKALDQQKIRYTLYNKVQPNPETHQVDEAVKIARDAGAKAVISIGGGSPIDAGKSVAILLEYPDKTCQDLYELKFPAEKAVPLVAINLTHGTGSEANRFAVVTIPEKGYKPAIAYDCIYPLYSIDDPALMIGLPANQTRYVSVDAVNHVVEAATTVLNNPFAITLGKEVVQLVAEYLPVAIREPKNLTARYFLAYAAMIAGTSFDNGLLHFTHALEHPLSGMKPELTHGLGLAVLLPAVIRAIYPACGAILADLLSAVAPGLTGDAAEAEKAAEGVRAWLKSVGITEKLGDVGFKESDVPQLVQLAFETPGLAGLLNSAPVELSKEIVEQIYRESF